MHYKSHPEKLFRRLLSIIVSGDRILVIEDIKCCNMLFESLKTKLN